MKDVVRPLNGVSPVAAGDDWWTSDGGGEPTRWVSGDPQPSDGGVIESAAAPAVLRTALEPRGH